MKENQIGALWNNPSQNPNAPAFKGSFRYGNADIKIVVWKNKWKQKGEHTPDFYIERDVPRDADSRPAATAQRVAPDAFDDDIPF